MLKNILHTLTTSSAKLLLGSTTWFFCGVVPIMAAPVTGPLTLSDIPLYSASGVPPNLLLTFDDSGSMSWGFLPDSVDSARTRTYGCSSTFNKIYYDPTIVYKPAVNASGTALNATETTFTSAYISGFNTGGGSQNLSTSYKAKWDMDAGGSGYSVTASCGTGTTSGQAAYYYLYDPTNTGCPATPSTTNENCYRKVTVGSASGPGTNDLNGDGLITAADKDERQNFANWFTYYSTRNLLAQTAVGRAFSNLGANMRVAAQHLNNTSAGSGASIKFTKTIGLMAPFTGAARTDFFTRLYNSPANGGTPLREAMKEAGDYFSGTGNNSPYRDVPGDGTSPERSCRQNFHILMTDGYWNGNAGVTTNADDTGVTFPAVSATDPYPYVTTYAPGGTDQKIYRDATSSTLADTAFDYWARDLRTDLTNDVPHHVVQKTTDQIKDFFNPKNDPAHWQHMVNYTIGLGIDGSLPNTSGTYDALLAGTQAWPPAVADTSTAVDDLWHAAINSRGAYFNATSAAELANSLTATLNDLGGRSGSAAAAATSTYYVDSGTSFGIYQTGYNSSGWFGRLRKFTGSIAANTGTLNITGPDWDAGIVINGQDPITGRKILTYNPTLVAGSRGVPFLWGNLSAAQQAFLMDDPDTTLVTETNVAAGQARLRYLRGDPAEEANTSGFNFRARTTSKLGDIASSAPLYVGKTLFKYSDTIQAVDPVNPTTAEKHSVFGDSTISRTPIIYVGANDGMLHGFNANNGTELLAYVPNSVFKNLNRLPSASYQHRFYVDGSPVHGDVFYGGSWKTVLVGGLNAGGQGIYALNITNPANFTEGNASSVVLWEFSDTSDSGDDNGDGFPDYELGYTFSEPIIQRVRTSATTTKWAAIFGNGYNNTVDDGAYSRTGYAFLYIVDIETGNLIKKISTKTGSVGIPNGLGTPSIVDWDGDQIVDYVYAGDLQGNLWKFDLTNNSPASWKVAYGDAATPRPLFIAQDTAATPNRQPITVAPEITFHPSGSGNGFLIFFGTGKILEVGDGGSSGATTQTIYGIWDKNTNGAATPVARSDLLQQRATETAQTNGIWYRNVTNNPMTWRTGASGGYLGWYLDLPDTGEKQVTNIDLKGGHLIFTTYVPSSNPCVSGGDGWQMELDYQSGGRLRASPFDTDLDGIVCECTSDNVTFATAGSTPPAGRKGSPIERTILHGKDVDYKIENPLSGAMPSAYKESAGKTDRGRQSWRQVK